MSDPCSYLSSEMNSTLKTNVRCMHHMKVIGRVEGSFLLKSRNRLHVKCFEMQSSEDQQDGKRSRKMQMFPPKLEKLE